jgi:DHA2 family multidrug resistance protein
VAHAELAAHITPFNPLLHGAGLAARLLDAGTQRGAALLDAMVNHQALILAYIDDFKAMMLVTAPAVLLLLLMRKPRNAPPSPAEHAVLD